MSQRYNYRQHKKVKAERKSARDLKNLHILPENSAEDLRSLSECCLFFKIGIHSMQD